VAGRRPLLGVCLGHQCIGEVYGGRIVRAPVLVHGKTSPDLPPGEGVLEDLPVPFEATRYHSLVVDRESLPVVLKVTAETSDGLIMGLRHRELDVEGVQFHPESVLTTVGDAAARQLRGSARKYSSRSVPAGKMRCALISRRSSSTHARRAGSGGCWRRSTVSRAVSPSRGVVSMPSSSSNGSMLAGVPGRYST
jgi:hypothetical protein